MAGESFGRAAERIQIDVWSDVMCPFCYMGDTLLDQALDRVDFRDQVDVKYHSFLLMPDLEVGAVGSIEDMMVTKRGMSRSQVASMNAQMTERAREVGLEFNLDRAVATNTRRAHELSHFAAEQGLQHQTLVRLFEAYFRDGINLSDRDTLATLGAEVGLDKDAALAALEAGTFADAVEADLQQAREYGISGVPFFVFIGKYAVSGAQPVEMFVQALETARAEANATAS